MKTVNDKSTALLLKKRLGFEGLYNLSTLSILETYPLLYNFEIKGLLFQSIETVAELANLLNLNYEKLSTLINQPEYKIYSIPKKRGGYREIIAPEEALKSVQRKLNYYLQGLYFSVRPKVSFGFIKFPIKVKKYPNHPYILMNAAIHLRKDVIVSIDLKDFFPSITAEQVYNLFRSELFQFNEKVATVLTLLTTYDGRLPTGAPTSPILSNFICIDMDMQIKEYCKQNSIHYTRYADDLTFSSQHQISENEVLDIISIILKQGFHINEKKLRFQRKGRRQIVTGIVVNKKLNVRRDYIKQIRAMLHDWQKNGLKKAVQHHYKIKSKEVTAERKKKFINKLRGMINYVGMIRGKQDKIYLKYYILFSILYKKPFLKNVR